MKKEAETEKELLEDPADLCQQLADVKKSRSEAMNSLRALQTSETRYRRLFETAQDGILILDAETGQIEDVNRYLIDILHYSHEEFLGMKLWEVSPFKNTILNQAAFQELQDKGYIRYKDLPLETKEGKSISVEFVSNVYKAGGNKVIQCNIRSTSESKDDRKKLQEAVIFQQRLIDVLPVPLFYKDSEGRYQGCNRSFEKLFGRKREEVTGKSVYDLYPKEIADIYHEKDLALMRNPGIQIYETILKDAGGVVHDVIFHKATFPNIDGSADGLIGAILDITDRNRAEKALRESESQFRAIFDDAPIGYHELDIEGRVARVNRTELAILGYSAEEMLGRYVWEFSDEKERAQKDMLGKLAGTVPPADNIERFYCRKDGTRIPALIQNRILLDHDGKITGIRTTLQDITERKRAEEELKQAFESLRKAFGATIQVLVSVVETRDPYTAGHQIRSADLARAIAKEIGLPQEKIDGIRIAGSIHDIGKLSIPAEILSKPTKLSEIEFSLIKEHARKGYEMLKDVESPWPLAEIIYQHHERMDGSGYPRNLKGEEICMEARILTIADVVEAIASHRPYRPSLGIETALAEIEKNRGIYYDKAAADACLRLFREKGYRIT